MITVSTDVCFINSKLKGTNGFFSVSYEANRTGKTSRETTELEIILSLFGTLESNCNFCRGLLLVICFANTE